MSCFAKTLGHEWAKASLHPRIDDLLNRQNYLLRITSLRTVASLSKVYPPDVAHQCFTPMVATTAADPVANVRLNTCKCIEVMLRSAAAASTAASSAMTERLVKIAQELRLDADRDVAHWAQALEPATQAA